MKKAILLIFLSTGAISMLVMSAHYLIDTDSGILSGKSVADQTWYVLAFRAHVTGGLIAIIAGPLQFICKLRERNLFWHRKVGFLYAVSILISALSGFVIAQFAMGGFMASLGFSILACLWLYSTYQLVNFAIKGKVEHHRRWTFYSYSLTFAAITQRTLLLVPLLTDIPFMPIYQLSAWIPWMLNLSIAHIIIQNTSRSQASPGIRLI